MRARNDYQAEQPCESPDHDWRPVGRGDETWRCCRCDDAAPWFDCLQDPEWVSDHEGELSQVDPDGPLGPAECRACPACTDRDRNRAEAAREPWRNADVPPGVTEEEWTALGMEADL